MLACFFSLIVVELSRCTHAIDILCTHTHLISKSKLFCVFPILFKSVLLNNIHGHVIACLR